MRWAWVSSSPQLAVGGGTPMPRKPSALSSRIALATPNVAAPVDLQRPKVLYEYRDPLLENRSSGQKILMRIGPDHAAVVKAKLREIRALLTQ